MALFAHPVCLGEPGGNLVIDFLNALETKRVQMISRRESFDPAKARMFEATRQDHMTVHPIFPNDESRETHPDLEGDPRLFGQNRDRAIPPSEREQFIEDCSHVLRFAGEMGSKRISPAGMRLVSIGELPSAIWAAPQRWIVRSVARCFALRLHRDRYRATERSIHLSSDRNSDNGQARCGNSRRSRARAAGNSAGTYRTSDRTPAGIRCR